MRRTKLKATMTQAGILCAALLGAATVSPQSALGGASSQSVSAVSDDVNFLTVQRASAVCAKCGVTAADSGERPGVIVLVD